MGGRRSIDEETVSLVRGGRRLSLYKSPEFFAVRFRGERIPETATGRLAAEVGLPASVRFVRRYSNRRTAIFHCHPADRDAVMDRLRSQRDAVHFVSHVLQRKRVNDLPGSEIGLDNKVFAEFRRSPSPPEIGQVQRDFGLRLIWRFPERPRATVFELTDAAPLNPLKISRRLMDTGRFRTVEPCLIETKIGKAVPSDAGFARQWHLLNVGQGGGLPGADCNTVAAWDHTWGRPGVTLALIDDGFDLQHPDLSSPGKVRAPYDATQHDPNPGPETLKDNHGTACAGLAVAARGAGAAVGVAPDCTLMPIRHAGEVGDYDESLAFRHAFQNGADVISCSWGPPDAYVEALWPLPSLTRVQLEMCAHEGRGGRGIPVFFAAGNGNESLELDGYASSDLVMAVAATTNRDEKAGYSDYGPSVWVCAPSSGGTLGVFTTDRTGPFGYDAVSDYTSEFSGTSAAAPLVAGVAALMLSVNPELTRDDVRRILKDTAVKINAAQPRKYQDHWGHTYSDRYDAHGHSHVFGWGRVDAGAAVVAAKKA